MDDKRTFSTHQRCRCGWRGTDIDCVIEDDEEHGITEFLCPTCGQPTDVMDDAEVQEWEHWQRQVSEAHSELMREWYNQPKPRQGKRPTRDLAELTLAKHLRQS